MTNTATKGRRAQLVDEQAREDGVIAEALAVLAKRIRRVDFTAGSPNATKEYLICRFGLQEREVFSVLWLDVRNRLIEHEILFYGTLSHCSVYPREIVKSGMRLNAAGALLIHNHPSGVPDPSEADRLLTKAIGKALELVDVRVLDHIIVAGTRTYSFAEHGEM